MSSRVLLPRTKLHMTSLTIILKIQIAHDGTPRLTVSASEAGLSGRAPFGCNCRHGVAQSTDQISHIDRPSSTCVQVYINGATSHILIQLSKLGAISVWYQTRRRWDVSTPKLNVSIGRPSAVMM